MEQVFQDMITELNNLTGNTDTEVTLVLSQTALSALGDSYYPNFSTGTPNTTRPPLASLHLAGGKVNFKAV